MKMNLTLQDLTSQIGMQPEAPPEEPDYMVENAIRQNVFAPEEEAEYPSVPMGMEDVLFAPGQDEEEIGAPPYPGQESEFTSAEFVSEEQDADTRRQALRALYIQEQQQVLSESLNMQGDIAEENKRTYEGQK